MKVFMGSSKEKQSLMAKVAALVGADSHTSLRWTDPAAFPGGSLTFDRLVELSSFVDAAVFILSDEDRTWYRGTDIPSPRDNVLFEYGLFVGRLGPRRVVIVREGKPVYPSDLAGLTYISYDLGGNSEPDSEIKFSHWLSTVFDQTGKQPTTVLPADAPIYRMLQVIDYLQLKQTRPTPGAIFHLLSGEDRTLEAMLLRAIRLRWVLYEPDGQGLMVYRLTPEGEDQVNTHTLPVG